MGAGYQSTNGDNEMLVNLNIGIENRIDELNDLLSDSELLLKKEAAKLENAEYDSPEGYQAIKEKVEKLSGTIEETQEEINDLENYDIFNDEEVNIFENGDKLGFETTDGVEEAEVNVHLYKNINTSELLSDVEMLVGYRTDLRSDHTVLVSQIPEEFKEVDFKEMDTEDFTYFLEENGEYNFTLNVVAFIDEVINVKHFLSEVDTNPNVELNDYRSDINASLEKMKVVLGTINEMDIKEISDSTHIAGLVEYIDKGISARYFETIFLKADRIIEIIKKEVEKGYDSTIENFHIETSNLFQHIILTNEEGMFSEAYGNAWVHSTAKFYGSDIESVRKFIEENKDNYSADRIEIMVKELDYIEEARKTDKKNATGLKR